MTAPASTLDPVAVDHYENFPVASWLCPPRLRPAVAAIYWFARTADDLADEGEAPADARLRDLEQYRQDLLSTFAGAPCSPRWSGLFTRLGAAAHAFSLPLQPLLDLLSAFEQDVRRTRDGQGYRDQADLHAYCSRSANPVGRLMLHLYGVQEPQALIQSDKVCTALQLINFWQDLGKDLARGRFYFPDDACAEQGLPPLRSASVHDESALRRALARQVQQARALMLEGQQLVHRVPGRAGWELRLVVQGGLRILDKIEGQGFDTLHGRPKLRAWDWPLLMWRSVWM